MRIRLRFHTGCLVGLGAIVSILAGGCARGAPPAIPSLPHVEAVSPLGVRRGVASELTVRGSGLSGNPRLVATFEFTAEAMTSGGPDVTTSKTRITVNPDTPLGIYPVRVLTDYGLSAPFPLVVGQLPQILEQEDRGNIDRKLDESKQTAQRLVLPIVVEGKFPKDDRDYFQFTGRKGQRIVADCVCARVGSGTDVDLWLGSRDREDMAEIHLEFGDPADSPLFMKLPDDGEYLIRILHPSYRPVEGKRYAYRLTLGALPAAAEIYPLGGRRGETIRVELRGGTLEGVMAVPVTLTPEPGESVIRLRVPTTMRGPEGALLDVEALPPLIVGDLPEVLEPVEPAAAPLKVTPPVVLNGRIDPPDDTDQFTVAVIPGQRLRVNVASRALGSALFVGLKLHDARGRELSFPPQATVVPARDGVREHESDDRSFEYTVPEGQTALPLALDGGWSDAPGPEASRSMIRGGSGHAYRVTIVTVTPTFSIALEEAQVTVPRGDSAPIKVTVSRDGFNGPIALRLAAPPVGLEVRPSVIAEGQTAGVLTLSAAADATFGPSVLDVVGEGLGPSGPIVIRATKLIAFGEPTTEPFRTTVDRIDNQPVYSHFPAYLRSRTLTQTGIYVSTAKATPPVKSK